jgi:hypothetical protein
MSNYGHTLTPPVVAALQKHYVAAHAAASDDRRRRITARSEEVAAKAGQYLALDEHEDAAVRRSLGEAGICTALNVADFEFWSQPGARGAA